MGATARKRDKKQLGQFFTTQAGYILQGMEGYVRGKSVSDPFAGSGDLLHWAKINGASSAKGFDIDRRLVKGRTISYRDSISNPGRYKFVITNPPYLNVNKADASTKKKYFSERSFEDLYQVSLRSIMNSEEGIVIVPINFLSAYNARSIRNLFFSKFEIDRMNYFREQVFADTTYNVIAFHYRMKRRTSESECTIRTRIFPGGEEASVALRRDFNWTIGGDVYEKLKKQENLLGIYRLVDTHVNEYPGEESLRGAYNHVKDFKEIKVSHVFAEKIRSNIMFLRAIDGGTSKSRIGLDDIRQHQIECLVSKPSSRHMIQLIVDKGVSLSQQERLIKLFNQELEGLRERHLSLFLTNYRDKDRKRVSFDFVYKLLNYLYEQHIAPVSVNNIFYEQVGEEKHRSRRRATISR